MEKPLTLKEFFDRLNSIIEEIGGADKVASHTYAPFLRVSIDDPYDNNEYEIVNLEPDMHLGCGCWNGVNIVLRKVD